MKGGQNFRDLQQKKKEVDDEAWVHQPICCICGRKCEGFHGRWGDSGTCDSACEAVQAAKPKYGEHTEEAFLKQFNQE